MLGMLEHHLKMSEIREAAVRFSRSRSAHTNTNILRAVACVVGGARQVRANVGFVVRDKSRKSEYGPEFQRVDLFL